MLDDVVKYFVTTVSRLIIGEQELGGDESFDIIVCTPKWLLEYHAPTDIIIGRHYVIVFEYNYDRLLFKLKSLVENTYGQSWEEIGLKISQIGLWEFENLH